MKNSHKATFDDDILSHITHSLEQMRGSERKIAETILKDPQAFLSISAYNLAERSNVSEPSVTRFSRAMGCQGFPDFKLRLAQSLAGIPVLSPMIPKDASTAEIVRRMTRYCTATLDTVGKRLDPQDMERAIEELTSANRIVIVGVGYAGVMAQELESRLLRIGLNVSAYSEPERQGTVALSLRATDLMIAISASGRSCQVLAAARLAKDRGARILALGRADTPLQRIADISIVVQTPDQPTVTLPLVTPLAHLMIIDTIVLIMILRGGKRLGEHLKMAKKLVNSARDL